ncbi:MAG: cell wall-binding repeat-containing protein [Actinomycetaceae bacterium]|nr:cell wall-binding repeat-containing protein [Actinomycetaceae bacterium]
MKSPKITGRAKGALGALLALGLVCSSALAAQAAPTVTRIYGADRYSTAVDVSVKHFTSAKTVYVASGTNYPDALAAGPAAAVAGAPILLVDASGPASTVNEIRRLAPTRIVIVGGVAAVSTTAEAAIKAAAPAATVQRLAGADRYETAGLVATSGWAGTGKSIYLASGTNYPDALAGGALAAKQGTALLLVQDGLAPSIVNALTALKPSKVVALGGTFAVSDAALNAAAGYVGGKYTGRIAGLDRFDTSARIAAEGWGATPERGIYVNGNNYPDALAAVPLSKKLDAPLFLVAQNTMPGSVYSASARTNTRYIVGGPAVVANGVVEQQPTSVAGSTQLCKTGNTLTLGTPSTPVSDGSVVVPILVNGKPVDWSTYGVVTPSAVSASTGVSVTPVASSNGANAGFKLSWIPTQVASSTLALGSLRVSQGTESCSFGTTSTAAGSLTGPRDPEAVEVTKVDGKADVVKFYVIKKARALTASMFQIRDRNLFVVGDTSSVKVEGSVDNPEDFYVVTLSVPNDFFEAGDQIWMNYQGEITYLTISNVK